MPFLFETVALVERNYSMWLECNGHEQFETDLPANNLFGTPCSALAITPSA